MVERLLHAGADVDVTKQSGQPPLLVAAGRVRGTVPPEGIAVMILWAALRARHRGCLPLPGSKRRTRAAATTKVGEQRGRRKPPTPPPSTGTHTRCQSTGGGRLPKASPDDC